MGTRARQRTSEWISGRPEKHKSERASVPERDDDEEETVCAVRPAQQRKQKAAQEAGQNRDRGYKIQNEGGAASRGKKKNNNNKAPKGRAGKSIQQRSSHGRQSGGR